MPLTDLPLLIEAVNKEVGEADAAMGAVGEAQAAVAAAREQEAAAQAVAATERGEAVSALDAAIALLQAEKQRFA